MQELEGIKVLVLQNLSEAAVRTSDGFGMADFGSNHCRSHSPTTRSTQPLLVLSPVNCQVARRMEIPEPL